jgi:hypothetical protein
MGALDVAKDWRYMKTTATPAWIILSGAKTRSLPLPLVCASFALGLLLFAAPVRGQQAIQGKDETPSKSESETTRLRTQLTEATHEFRANLEKLVAVYEAAAKQAEGRLAEAERIMRARTDHARRDGNVSKLPVAETEKLGAGPVGSSDAEEPYQRMVEA